MGKYCFGIDVGGTSVKCGLFKTTSELIEKWEIPTRVGEDGSQILPDIAMSIASKVNERGIRKEDIEGIGIGVPGPVNEVGEIPGAVNLNWGYKHIAKEMEELSGVPSKAGNDANVAALGEAWAGGAKGARNVILATLGTGVGGGIIVDGKIVAGTHGAGGEIGHAAILTEEEESCNCGNVGCLEQAASATGIARLARRRLQNYEGETSLRGMEITAKDVFDAYKEKDKLAIEVIEEFSDYLGRALAIFACVIDPEVILLGGGVSKAGQILIDCLEEKYRKYAFPSCKDTPIRLATLGNEAGIYGAAKLVVHNNQ